MKQKKCNCQGRNFELALDQADRYIDDLFTLALFDRARAKENLALYMEAVETERDLYKFKYHTIINTTTDGGQNVKRK